jgi:hypothetical protein
VERITLAVIQVIADSIIKTKNGTEFKGVAAVLVAVSIIMSAFALIDNPALITQFLNTIVR